MSKLNVSIEQGECGWQILTRTRQQRENSSRNLIHLPVVKLTQLFASYEKKKKDKMEDAAAPSRAGEFITAAIQTAGADSARVKGTGGISGLKSAR